MRFAPWQVVDRSSDTVRLEHLLYPQPGYPFALRLSVAYELSPDGLRVQTTATNEGDVPLPYGEGHHPYLAAGAGLLVDDCTLTAPGATRLTTDERQLPTGSEPVEGTRYDLRAGRVVGDLRIDHCFTDLRTGRRRAGPGAAHRPRRARVGALAGRGVQPPAAVHRRRGGPGAAPAGAGRGADDLPAERAGHRGVGDPAASRGSRPPGAGASRRWAEASPRPVGEVARAP